MASQANSINHLGKSQCLFFTNSSKNCRGRNTPKLILQGHYHPVANTRQTYRKKGKLQTNIIDKYRCKNPQQIIANRIPETEQETKGIKIGKEEVKLALFACDMILQIENPKDTTRTLLELNNEFSNVTGYKINTQKSLLFLYTNKKNQKKKLRKESHSPLQQQQQK